MFALIDCNNFYASCERLFRPDLAHRPIIVLSNNDGCVIARSNEAKALGILMGEPFFKISALCKQYQVTVFSSNFALYGDISHRVMSTIEESWTSLEIYSIDEAFLDLSTLPTHQRTAFCHALQQRVLRNIGIPTSIGIGKTKTLAKLANHIAKKVLKTPVFDITHQETWLDKIAIRDVWGVGRQWEKKLLQKGIGTAHQLAVANRNLIQSHFNTTLLRTAMELNGIPCQALEVPEKRQSIVSSRSFGSLQTEYSSLAQAISRHCATAYEKMRQQHLMPQYISVFVRSSQFRTDLSQYHQSISLQLNEPTDDLRYLTHIAKFCLQKIYKKGIHYKKVGVMMTHLIDKSHRQLNLFHPINDEKLALTERLLTTMDEINQKFGRHTLYLAAEGCHQRSAAMKQQMKSPSYTTQWSALPLVKVAGCWVK